MPLFLKLQVHDVGASEAWPAPLFWNHVATQSLRKLGIEGKEALDSKQISLVAEEALLLRHADTLERAVQLA